MKKKLHILICYSLLIYCMSFGLPEASAIQITSISNNYVFEGNLDEFIFTKIEDGEWVTFGMTGCNAEVGKVEAYWSNWANSYWYDVKAERVDRSTFRVYISKSFTGGVNKLRGSLRGTGCQLGSLFFLKTQAGGKAGGGVALVISPENSSTYNVSDMIVFKDLAPYVTSEPQLLFKHAGGQPGRLTVQGKKLEKTETTVLDDNDAEITVDSSGCIRFKGKKAGAYSKQLIVSLTLD